MMDLQHVHEALMEAHREVLDDPRNSAEGLDLSSSPPHREHLATLAAGASAEGMSADAWRSSILTGGYSAECAMTVASISPSGQNWLWSDAGTGRCSKLYLGATSNGGVVVSQNESSGNAYYSLRDGSLRWSRALPPPHGGALMERSPLYPVSAGQMSYDLRRLRTHGLITRTPGTHRYHVTDAGLHHALFLTRVHDRLLRGGLAHLADPADRRLRTASRAYQVAVDDLTFESGLAA